MKKLFVLVTAAALSLGVLTGCDNRKSQLEESAKPVVTNILSNTIGSRGAKCLKVKITEKVDEKHYRGVATLDNGNEIKIMIEDRGDQVYVSIPLNQ